MIRQLQVLFFCLCGIVSVAAQTPASPAATNAPAASVPVAIALGDVVSQAQSALSALNDEQTNLASDQTARDVDTGLPSLAQKIDARLAADTKMLAAAPSLYALQNSQAAWQALANELADSARALTDRGNQVNALTTDLDQKAKIWQATLTAAQAGHAPAEVLQRIDAVRTAIDGATKPAQGVQAQILSVQSRLVQQDARIKNGLDVIAKAQDVARHQLLKRDHSPLWMGFEAPVGASVVTQEHDSVRTQVLDLQTYLEKNSAALYIHLLILVVLIIAFYAIQKIVRTQAAQEPALENAARVFDVPLAIAVLLALLASAWLYPERPHLLSSLVGAIALIPAVIILRRLIEAPLFPILYAVMAAYLVDQIRYILLPSGVASRLLLIFELLAGSLFLLWLLHSKRLKSPLRTDRLERTIRTYIHVTLFIFLSAGFAGVWGCVELANLLGDAMLRSSYLSVIFYAAVRIVDALVISVLSVRPLTHLRLVNLHRDLLYRNTAIFIRWVAFIFWFLAVLQLFSVRDPLWHGIDSGLHATFKWGSISLSLGPLLRFAVTIWASFMLSRFLRFVLEEEVYPHLQLGRGVPYAASTMVHYTVLVLGFFVAMEALNIDLSQFTILAGAFGVGLGFGLQNIMNNFVSGVILLFERPIKVGDIIQVDASTGVVERIGIRASVIRLANGSEVIVPNGNLISNPVTNWSLSSNKRVIEIPVTVTSKVEPQHVIELLTKVAEADARVLKNPAPQTLLITLAATALTFRLRAWVSSEKDWMQVTSDLSLAINAALARENIAIS